MVEIETGQPFQDLAELRAMPGVKLVEQDGLLLKVTTQAG